ncbi:methylated-DNA--[protein]-cysteine S-methyltransferase [Algisphaera agarilytica]|uniref:Methylated-DNA--protein-cysteine methyltransferase n=1 Tax=Algisphaera agarilytica TaxID=1385975 RepID=A0A7X0H6B5_9BACT|nr:methylated-DNA--[protein]-cysteine S-methyltransferase [Algisphaera agarilytica]MBB6428901.1 methylated-DNA-[protein]-cysteine S-methyltransferase [Algisphaera agarilytica]
MSPTAHTTINSPVGPLRLCATDTHLTRIDFVHGRKITPLPDDATAVQHADDHPVFVETARQLAAYFAGESETFDLPLAPQGTEFQLRVWQQLRLIPFGTTISYGQLAQRLGQPNASRAVGLANGNNPLSIVVPCHRVIGADGSLTGFGGGIDTKRQLLELESPSLFALSKTT